MTTLRNRAMHGAAWALSSVTVVTVCLAIYALVDDKRLAALYAGAFALLDLVKYLLWPTARDEAASGRRWSAFALFSAATVLAIGSGLATAERFTSAALARAAQQQAHEQRLIALDTARRDARRELESLDSAEAATRTEADALRARGIASPATALQTAELARIDARRSEARARLDAATREQTDLQAQPAAIAPSAGLAPLLGIGLALALEIIPALLLTIVRSTPPALPAAQDTSAPDATEETSESTNLSFAETCRRMAAAANNLRMNFIPADQRPPHRNPPPSGPAPNPSAGTPSPDPRRRSVPHRAAPTPAIAT